MRVKLLFVYIIKAAGGMDMIITTLLQGHYSPWGRAASIGLIEMPHSRPHWVQF